MQVLPVISWYNYCFSVLFVLNLYTGIHAGTVEVLSTSTCPFHFKACNLFARLEKVPAFGNLYQVCCGVAQDSELKDYLLY